MIKKIAAVALIFVVTACGSSVKVTNVNFAQPVETVMTANSNGDVSDARSGLSFNIREVLDNEGISRSDFGGTSVRVIKNHNGYYFVTARGFRNVYVMEVRENELRAKEVIRISSERLTNPVLNQRDPNIQLVDGDRSWNLRKDGIRN